ncbi:MAG: O-antigen ligase family protein [Bryobacteraceae bacterium]
MIPIVIPALFLFLIPPNVDTSTRRNIVVIALFCSLLGLALAGIRDYHVAPERSKFVMTQGIDVDDDDAAAEDRPAVYRLKAQGLIDDPNDFAQMLLITVSLSFIWWSRNWLKNILFVLIPGSILIYAVYLTHSRGALVAIGVMITVAFRRKLRLLGSLTLASVVAIGLLSSRFTGGREVGLSGGADRLELWSEGWELIKRSPLYGYGFGGYVDAVNSAAHNSFLVVAVDTGLLGLVIWVSIFVISIAQLNRIVTPSDGTPPDPTLRQHAVCIEAALTSFLATSWFLSRAYYPISFLLVGLVGGLVYQESVRRPGAELLPPWKTCLIWSIAASAAALALMYVMIRLRAV